MSDPGSKAEFSVRLRYAMARGRRKLQTPTELASAFNLEFQGRSVTVQAVQKWLAGNSIPTADKVAVLASMFRVSPRWLRYGTSDVNHEQKQPSQMHPEANPISDDEVELITRLRRMPEYRRLLLIALVNDLSIEYENWKVE